MPIMNAPTPEGSDPRREKGSDRLRTAAAIGVALVVALTPVVIGAVRSRSAPSARDPGRTSAGPPAGGEDHVHFIAFAPGSGDKIYVGTHTGLHLITLRRDAEKGRTIDTLGLRGQDVMNVALDPGRPDWILVGGHNVLSESRDGGRTWRTAGGGLPAYDLHGLTGTARSGRVVAYVVGNGIYASDDGGRRWEKLGDGPASGRLMTLAADPGDENLLYAGDLSAGVFRSEDGGRTWTPASEGLADRSVMALAVAPGASPALLAATGGGVFLSGDGGRHWQPGSGLPAEPVFAVAVNPARTEQVFAFASSGWYVSTDGGKAWTALR